MNRRGFLSMLVGAIAADPDKLIWESGRKLISIPSPTVWVPPAVDGMLALHEYIAKLGLEMLANHLKASFEFRTRIESYDKAPEFSIPFRVVDDVPHGMENLVVEISSRTALKLLNSGRL